VVQSSVIQRGSSRAIATLMDGVTREEKACVSRGFSRVFSLVLAIAASQFFP
jgi:hypothetical protein